MQVNCCICGASTRFSRCVHDDRYGYPGIYTLLQCYSCGHRFIKDVFAADKLQSMYSQYYPRSNYDLEKYRPFHKSSPFFAWLNGELFAPFLWVPSGTTILDVGCGFGESIGYLQANGCSAFGVEADENVCRVVEKFGFKIHIGLFDPDLYERNYFDYVTLGQVIEHVTDPLKTMRDISLVLKHGGTIILSTPNAEGWGARVFGRYWISWHAPYHLHFFTKESMQKIADQAGLHLYSVKTITPSDWLYNQWNHLNTFPDEGKSSIYWSLKGHWKIHQSLLRLLFDVSHHLKLNHLITRFFDAIGKGDNRLYFLRKP